MAAQEDKETASLQDLVERVNIEGYLVEMCAQWTDYCRVSHLAYAGWRRIQTRIMNIYNYRRRSILKMQTLVDILDSKHGCQQHLWPCFFIKKPLTDFIDNSYYGEGLEFWDEVFLASGLWSLDDDTRLHYIVRHQVEKKIKNAHGSTAVPLEVDDFLKHCAEAAKVQRVTKADLLDSGVVVCIEEQSRTLFMTLSKYANAEAACKNRGPDRVSEDFAALLHRVASVCAAGGAIPGESESKEVRDILASIGFAILSDEQVRALRQVANNAISIVTGGGGTGKTSIVAKVVYECARRTIGVAAMLAPSHCARKVLASSLRVYPNSCETVQRFSLMPDYHIYNESSDVRFGNLVIVDECSMVELFNMRDIFKVASAYDLHVLLIGDPMQLPPVGIGQIFRNLVSTNALPHTNLTRVYRMENEALLRVCTSIREHEYRYMLQEEHLGSSVSYTRANALDMNDLRSLKREKGDDDFVVLTYMNRDVMRISSHLHVDRKVQVGDWVAHIVGKEVSRGYRVRSVNRNEVVISNKINQRRTCPVSSVVHELAKGQLALFVKKNQDNHYVNGDLGIIEQVTWDGFVVRHAETNKSLTEVPFEHCMPSAVRTIHRSQGQSWHTVVGYVPWGVAPVQINTQSLYTLASRAKVELRIVDARGAFTKPHAVHERDTTMQLFRQGYRKAELRSPRVTSSSQAASAPKKQRIE